MRLDDYKCTRMNARATRQGVAWVALIEGDTVFMFTDRGDGGIVELRFWLALRMTSRRFKTTAKSGWAMKA